MRLLRVNNSEDDIRKCQVTLHPNPCTLTPKVTLHPNPFTLTPKVILHPNP